MFVGVTWKDDATVITAAGWLGSTMQLFEVGPDRELRLIPVESIAARVSRLRRREEPAGLPAPHP